MAQSGGQQPDQRRPQHEGQLVRRAFVGQGGVRPCPAASRLIAAASVAIQRTLASEPTCGHVAPTRNEAASSGCGSGPAGSRGRRSDQQQAMAQV